MFRLFSIIVCVAAPALCTVACEKKSEPVKPAAPAKSEGETKPQITQAQRDAYPLKTCVVTGEKIGGHGDPYEILYKGQLVRFCCDGCLEDFNKEPEKYMAKIAAAAKAQTPAK